MLLLDTHVMVWLLGATGALRRETIDAIDRSAGDRDLHVSVMAFWELGLLVEQGRVRLNEPFADWLHRAKTQFGITVAPLTEQMAFDSTQLPGEFHRDPADRFMVATARQMDATLITRDSRILRYGAEGHVQVMEA